MSFPGITNYGPIPVPGTDVVGYLGVRDAEPDVWYYSLWTDDDEAVVAAGDLDLKGLNAAPEQVVRIAFILHEHDECDDMGQECP